MIDYRFTGRISSEYEYVDIRFRTDAINSTDQTFNITQVQVGQEFTTKDKSDAVYQRWLSGNFKETNTTLGAMIQFSINNNLDLRAIDSKGNETFVVNDASASAS